MNRMRRLSVFFVFLLLSLVFAGSLTSCGSSKYHTGTDSSHNTSASSIETSDYPDYNLSHHSESPNPVPVSSKPEYEDSRWPTTYSELLDVPEYERWYNAWDSVGSYCTIVGPVVDVYQAVNESGMPVFVSIGVDYPDRNSVTLVIWASHLDQFESMLYDIDHGGAWISVTSYLDTYNGYLQFSSDNYVACEYWVF